jgi:osmoprotectant transport system ATP-binding protein
MPDEFSTAIEFTNAGFCLPDGREILSELSLSIRRAETLVLVGRSGSGKTTSLKLINRLLNATSGDILVDDVSVGRWDIIKLRRRVGYAIQDVGLFPHYSVFENVALIPKLERWDPARIRARVQEMLALVGLPIGEFAHRYPNELSGGQRQRVGLARALAADPPILLMDEPFGALDPITRAELRREFKKLQEHLGKTIVFVTHDVGEALELGTRIALMEQGRLRGVFTKDQFLTATDASVKAYIGVFRAGQQIFSN